MNVEIPEAFQCMFDPQWRDIALYGGRSGGKTHNVGGALVIQAAQKSRRVVCAREMQNSIRDSSKALIEDKIKDYDLGRHFIITDQEIRGARPYNEDTRFIFKGMWRNPDAIKSLEGADDFWGDEASRFSERSIRLIRPTMRKPGSRMIWTWNPEFDHDPIDRMFRGQTPPPNSYVREISYKDNPWFKGSPLEAEMAHDYAVDFAKADHVWGGKYVSAVDGSYYTQQLSQARSEGRITALAKDPVLTVRAFWDLGYRDATSIWIAQFVGQKINVLDYIEGKGQQMAFYIEQLRARGWGEAIQELPHDGVQQRVTAVGSAEEILRHAGFTVRSIPNQGKGAALERVEAARRLFPRIWFNDDPHVASGLKALAAYHERKDEKRNIGLGPMHDWASDPADAFGLMCVAYEEPEVARKRPERRTYRGAGGFMG